MNPLDAWNNTQVFLLKDLAIAHGEYFIVQAFHTLLKKIDNNELKTNKDTKECLQLLF